MLFIAAAITTAGVVLLVAVQRGESLGTRLATAGSLLVCNAVFCAGIYIGCTHPEWSVKYGLRRKEGRLGFGRIPQPVDPEGLRLRYYGCTMPGFALIMTLGIIFEDRLDSNPAWFVVLLLILCAGIGATVGYVEHLLHKQQ